MDTLGPQWWAAIIIKYDKMNRARVGLKFHEWDWNFQSFILKWPLKLTCVITFDYDMNCARVWHGVSGCEVWNNCRSRGGRGGCMIVRINVCLLYGRVQGYYQWIPWVAAPAVRWSGILKSHVRGGLSAASLVISARIAVCNTWSSGGTALCRVGGATSQLDLPSLTPLSVAGCGWLQLGAPHWATSVITASSW